MPFAAHIRGTTPALSVAPMMDRTDRHFRFVMRQITRHTLLWSEMVTANAILHGDQDYLLAYSEEEHPVVLQLGGDDPASMATCAQIAVERYGYDEVNINVGCPSPRVQKGNFGACLMQTPDTVAECVAAMRAAVDVPVTVKHRIGVDDLDQYEDMVNFVRIVEQSGCDRFSVHARKAWLQGLSPKENRNIPPLRYDEVYQLKREFPHLPIEINGGIRTLDATLEHLEHVDAVMIGRAAVDTPWIFAEADARIFGDDGVPTRRDVLDRIRPYVEAEVAKGERLHRITKHLLNWFAGEPGTKAWKRVLTQDAVKPGAGFEVIERAYDAVMTQQQRIGLAS